VTIDECAIETARGSLPVFVAVPDSEKFGPGPYPGVVVLHDITGAGEDLRSHVERMASYGFVAVGPNLFANGRPITCIARAMRDLVRRRGPVLADVMSAGEWLTSRADCTGKTGVVGFCLGGGFALLAAAQGFDAAAPFYGQIPVGQGRALQDACPIVASFGKLDPTLPAAGYRLRRTLEKAGITHDIKTYSGVGHSFANKIDLGVGTPLLRVTGFGYDENTANHAWGRVRTFFDEHLARGESD
jgi:carboxymethylenebutenolidase